MKQQYLFSATHCLAAAIEGYALYRKTDDHIPVFVGLDGTETYQPMRVTQRTEQQEFAAFIEDYNALKDELGLAPNLEEIINSQRPAREKTFEENVFIATAIISSEEEFSAYRKKFPDAQKLNIVAEKDVSESLSDEQLFDFATSHDSDFDNTETMLFSQIKQIKNTREDSADIEQKIQTRYTEKRTKAGEKDRAFALGLQHKDKFLSLKDAFLEVELGPFYKQQRIKEINQYILASSFEENENAILGQNKAIDFDYIKSITVKGLFR